jgi:UDP-glucose 4-epimerase
VDEPPERYGKYVGSTVEYQQGDITDEGFRTELLADSYDRIYHFAAIVGVEDYVKNPLSIIEVNVVATKEILETVRNQDTRFVFTSTSEIYGKNPDVPWSETDDRVLGPPTIDRWNYSIGKSLCEHMLHGIANEDNPLSATVIRPFNLYGPGQRPKFVVPAFVNEVVNEGVPTVYDGGTQTRCFTYIDDFIEGVIRASISPAGENEVFNLGSTRETRIDDLAELVLELAGHSDRDPKYIDTDELYGDTYEDLDRRVPDTSKAIDFLDWEAETSLEEGLESVIDWGRNNY